MAPTLFDPADQAGWIVIVGWRRFQHYRDRDPVWIKAYLDVLDRDEYLDLPGATRALLHGLWLLTARRSGTNRELARYERGTDEEPTGNEPGTIRADTRKLSRMLSLKVSTHQLEALRDAGFIEITASKPASTSASTSLAEPERPRARDRAPGEGEEEKEKEQGEGRTSPHDRQPEEPPDFTNLDPALELEVARLVFEVTKKDNGSETVLRSYASRLPLGAVVKVRESAAGKPAGYAVSALKDELRERGLL